MPLSKNAENIADELSQPEIRLGDIKKLAKEIKSDHSLALELWSTKQHNLRLLSVLILDKKQLEPHNIETMIDDLSCHSYDERNQITEWLLANQLTKSKRTLAFIEQWQDHSYPLLRRLFWYHQARLRWTGKTPHDNTLVLLAKIESSIGNEEPEVQWVMNFCAAWIGLFEPSYRDRCIQLGLKHQLYADEKVSAGCTPSYLPEFIRIEAAKRNL